MPAFRPASTGPGQPGNSETGESLPAVEIRLLGGFRVVVGDRAITDDAWRLRKARGLVKLLALAPGHRLHREELIDVLWPDLDPDAAANALRYALHRARCVFATSAPGTEAILRSHGDLLALRPEGPLWIDVDAFETA